MLLGPTSGYAEAPKQDLLPVAAINVLLPPVVTRVVHEHIVHAVYVAVKVAHLRPLQAGCQLHCALALAHHFRKSAQGHRMGVRICQIPGFRSFHAIPWGTCLMEPGMVLLGTQQQGDT